MIVDPVFRFCVGGVSAPPFFYVINYTLYIAKSQEKSTKKCTFLA